ncbi:MAG: hypothetical protein CM15mP77_4510 [Synechococcus sp.]|nr:MAG: hypothetical protein CM15mP77_4510 [Synechococcus sp.]
MGAGLLVAHQRVCLPSLRFQRCARRRKSREDRPAWVAEDRVHPMAPQRIHERFRTADGLRCIGVQSTDNRGCGCKVTATGQE